MAEQLVREGWPFVNIAHGRDCNSVTHQKSTKQDHLCPDNKLDAFIGIFSHRMNRPYCNALFLHRDVVFWFCIPTFIPMGECSETEGTER